MGMLDFGRLRSPILLAGNAVTAYRDPAVYFRDGAFHLFFTLVETDGDGGVSMYLAKCVTRDFVEFSPVRKLTPKDRRLNYSSPGTVVFFDGKYRLCCQTYCRENGEKYGNERCRIFLMSSPDLESWGEPEMLMVKGDAVRAEDMGRMIDPYLIRNDAGEWYCFFKQDGVSFSSSPDLRHWTFRGHTDCGENVCVIRDGGIYRLWHSPANGIGEKVSDDLIRWRDTGRLITLGQKHWPWAQGRLTAGMVLDLRREAAVGKALLFFHGTGPEDERTVFDQYACIGMAWSDDLIRWEYAG